MYINDLLEAWAHTLPIPLPVHVPQISNTEKQQMQDEKSHLVTFKAAPSSDDPTRIGENVDGYRTRGDDTTGEGKISVLSLVSINFLFQLLSIWIYNIGFI